MSSEAVRQQILGVLVEEGLEYVEIAQKFESDLVEHIKKEIASEDEKVKASNIMGLTLAMFRLEEIAEDL